MFSMTVERPRYTLGISDQYRLQEPESSSLHLSKDRHKKTFLDARALPNLPSDTDHKWS